MTICEACRRVLVPAREWMKLDPARRKRLGQTHAKGHSTTLCQTDYMRAKRADESDEVYRGEWVRDGLIMRPADPRPVDPPPKVIPVNLPQPIRHGTDSGYHIHRKRKEMACDECRLAHAEHERRRVAARRERAA